MHAKKTNKTKLAVVLLALALLVGCAAGATLAWLVTKTDPIVNTFTVGDINITLTETDANQVTGKLEKSFKMVPGSDIAKDPTVTVLKDSEECYLFVKVEKSANFDSFMSYDMATGWKELTEGSGVYYREVGASTADQPFYVLAADTAGNNANGSVHVLDTVTKDMMATAKANAPTLTFTAYAVQKDNIDSAADAWYVAINGKLPPTTP